MTRAGRIAALVVAVALAGLAGASVARADAVVTVPSDIVAEAQGPSGAQVTYEASAKESETETDLPISCTNPDGSTSDGIGTIDPTVLFPLGQTTVVCSTTTGESASFKVTVQDTTPPTVTPPAPVTAEATGPSGAVVSYGAASASDLVDGCLRRLSGCKTPESPMINKRPNMRVQRTRSSASPPHSPLTRNPLGAGGRSFGDRT